MHVSLHHSLTGAGNTVLSNSAPHSYTRVYLILSRLTPGLYQNNLCNFYKNTLKKFRSTFWRSIKLDILLGAIQI